MVKNRSNQKKTTDELVAELNEFHHYQSAGRLEHFARLLRNMKRCEHCGRTDCERMK